MKDVDEQNFMAMLSADVHTAMKRRAESDSQQTRRDVVRAIWSAIDGIIWIFREHVIDCATMTYGLEDAEVAVLSETVYNVSASGVIKPQAKFLPLLSIFRLVARIAERVEPVAKIDFGRSGWSKLTAAQKVRNRITHPKSREDLFLNDLDMAITQHGFFWLVEQTVDSMAQLNLATKDYLGRLHEVFDKLKSGDPEITMLYDQLSEEADRDDR